MAGGQEMRASSVGSCSAEGPFLSEVVASNGVQEPVAGLSQKLAGEVS